MFRITLFICLFFTLTFPASLFADEKNIVLTGNGKAGIVMLRWSVKEWHEGLVGFDIKRRLIEDNKKAADSEWNKLNREVIRPEVSPEKNWSLIEECSREQKRLKQKTEAMIKQGNTAKTSPEEYLKILTRSRNELIEITNNIKNSADYALIHGFGYVDRKFQYPGEYEYGLFPVYTDRAEKLPLSVFRFKMTDVYIEWIKLLGSVHDGVVKLKWTIEDYWPQDVTGLTIMRRDEVRKWKQVTPEPIYPGVNEDRKWANLGLDSREQKHLKLKLKDQLSRGRLKSFSRDEFLSFAKSASINELKSVNILSFKDYDYALMTGFGCIVRSFSADNIYEYGLFSVDINGTIHEKPISTFIVRKYNEADPGFKTHLTVEKAHKGSVLRWSYSMKEFHKRALCGYNVYRTEAEAKGKVSYQKLNRSPITTAKKQDGNWVWHYIDRKADNTKQYIYAVAPVDHFQKEYERTIEKYEAKPADFELYKLIGEVNLESIEQKSGAVEMKWNFNSEYEKWINGFVVERSKLPSQELKPITTILSPKIRMFRDKHKKKEGEVYTYRISIMGKDRIIKSSATKTLYYMEIVKSPPPDALTAKYVDGADGAYIYISWKKFEYEIDKQNAGYVVFSDVVKQGEMAREVSTPLISDTHYVFRLGARRGREFSFGIAGKSRSGIVGEIAKASCYVPLKELPKVKNLRCIEINQGNQIKLRWDYDDVRELDGFEIHQNGNNVTKDVVGRYEKEWISSELKPNTLYRFQVVAKSYLIGTSKYNKKIEYFYIQKP